MFALSLDIRYSGGSSPEYPKSTCLDVLDIESGYSCSISSQLSGRQKLIQLMSSPDPRHCAIFASPQPRVTLRALSPRAACSFSLTSRDWLLLSRVRPRRRRGRYSASHPAPFRRRAARIRTPSLLYSSFPSPSPVVSPATLSHRGSLSLLSHPSFLYAERGRFDRAPASGAPAS